MFGHVVLDVPKSSFDHAFDAKKKQRRAKLDTELDAAALREVIGEFKKIVRQTTDRDFPQDRKNNSPWRGTQSSAHGSMSAPAITGASTISLMILAPRQRAKHGLRQPGRDQRHRCRLHA